MEQTALTAHDRCDRCGAQAYARTAHEAGSLLWCAHHFAAHSDVLTAHLVVLVPVPVDSPVKAPAGT